MNLYEYMGKEIFRKYGVPVPEGYVVGSASEIKEYRKPVVVKSQILLGGRGKSGGIKFARSQEELRNGVTELLGSKIRGLTVTKVLVEEMLAIEHEYYVSIALNRSERSPVLIASSSGGVEIESVPASQIFTRKIDPLLGYSDYIGREASKFMSLPPEVSSQFRSILASLYRIFQNEDCELVEINPLVLTKEKKLVAADAKVVMDSDSMFRHKDINITDPEKTPLELEAQAKGYSFIELDGQIGVIANGAGLTMATLDALTLHNGKPRNFLDLGGTDSVDIVINAFDLVLKANPRAILVNIFGGVTKADTVAKGIAEAKKKYNITRPLVVRLSGVNEDEGRAILKENGVESYPTMMEAVERVVKLAGGKQ
ncbi:ADP-forming succinate--CoA ligase subunit beta [Thermoplasmatales archaeon AK]|nr:ADP-forming succinate--CoA ligase subunit beta [Thermoplasmatales archaeon AK]